MKLTQGLAKGDEAVLVVEVFQDVDIREAGGAVEVGGLGTESLVDFDNGEAAGFQEEGGPVGDGPVEEEGVGIGDEEGQVGFMVKDIGAHEGLFGVHDVRGIAYQDVELL